MTPDENLTDHQINQISCEIIKKLDGIPMGQACYILKRAKFILLDAHMVDTGSQRFIEKINDIDSVEFDSSSQAVEQKPIFFDPGFGK